MTPDEQKQQALKAADDAYNNIHSPHYRDNERFSWAVQTITKKFAEDESEIQQFTGKETDK